MYLECSLKNASYTPKNGVVKPFKPPVCRVVGLFSKMLPPLEWYVCYYLIYIIYYVFKIFIIL